MMAIFSTALVPTFHSLGLFGIPIIDEIRLEFSPSFCAMIIFTWHVSRVAHVGHSSSVAFHVSAVVEFRVFSLG